MEMPQLMTQRATQRRGRDLVRSELRWPLRRRKTFRNRRYIDRHGGLIDRRPGSLQTQFEGNRLTRDLGRSPFRLAEKTSTEISASQPLRHEGHNEATKYCTGSRSRKLRSSSSEALPWSRHNVRQTNRPLLQTRRTWLSAWPTPRSPTALPPRRRPSWPGGTSLHMRRSLVWLSLRGLHSHWSFCLSRCCSPMQPATFGVRPPIIGYGDDCGEPFNAS